MGRAPPLDYQVPPASHSRFQRLGVSMPDSALVRGVTTAEIRAFQVGTYDRSNHQSILFTINTNESLLKKTGHIPMCQRGNQSNLKETRTKYKETLGTLIATVRKCKSKEEPESSYNNI